MTIAGLSVTGMHRARISPLIDYPVLLFIAAITDITIPFLIWKGFLPDITRWITDLAIVTMLLWAIVRMLSFDHIPRGFLLILSLTLIGAIAAAFEGQQGAATVWGWWQLFRFPMLAIYAYLQPVWPQGMGRRVIQFCMVLLAIQVLVQIGQYLTGEPPGDNLAGTFGQFGTGNLVLFIIFTWCLALGQWLLNGEWKQLAWVLMLGGLSSALGEMKIFPLMVLLLGLLALLLYQMQGGNLRMLVLYVAILSIVVLAFVGIYNQIVAQGSDARRIEEYLNWEKSDNYINGIWYHPDTDTYEFGRGFAVTYAWQQVAGDLASLLFGRGIGSQNESTSLGIVGIGLQKSLYGITVGSTLPTLLQEIGVIGLSLIGFFFLWVVFSLYRLVNQTSDASLKTLCYALLLFTLGWPLWFWYGDLSKATMPMILFWGSLGYVLNQLRRPAKLDQLPYVGYH